MLDRTGNAQIADICDAALPSQDEAHAALERIVSSSEFIASPHLAAFLKFSVEKSLAGEGHTIKAYSVATGVLGRPPTFDPQADPIVRVEATRLRRALERYYLHEGAHDPILIDIPRGRYIAYFSYRNESAAHHTAPSSHDAGGLAQPDGQALLARESPSSTRVHLHAAWRSMPKGERRSIAVFAFALIGATITWTLAPILSEAKKPVEQALVLQQMAPAESATPITGSIAANEAPSDRIMFAMLQLTPLLTKSDHPDSDMMAHRLVSEIALHASEFEGIPVIDPDMPTVFVPTSPHLYSLVGSMFQSHDNAKLFDVSFRLVHQLSREIVWTRNFSIDGQDKALDGQVENIATSVVGSLAGLNGAIRVDDARRHHDPELNSTSCQICLADSDIALRTENPEQITKAISCLSTLATRKPGEALIFKQLAALRMALKSPSDVHVKNMTMAIADLETAARLSPDDVTARAQLQRLQNGTAIPRREKP